jgi:putative transposase
MKGTASIELADDTFCEAEIQWLEAHGIGRGRALGNIIVERLWCSVKYEDVYLKGYAGLPDLLPGLTEYFAFCNSEHPHQSPGYRPPDEVYCLGEGGGARIVDKFGDAPGPSPAQHWGSAKPLPIKCAV